MLGALASGKDGELPDDDKMMGMLKGLLGSLGNEGGDGKEMPNQDELFK